MPSCLPFACSNKSGKLNETKNFFKVPPDPKNNRDSCSCTTLVRYFPIYHPPEKLGLGLGLGLGLLGLLGLP